MSKVFNRLEYVGTGKGVIVNILPSRLSVKVSKDTPYEFRPTDQMDEVAEHYYKSMKSIGIELINNDSTPVNIEVNNSDQVTENINESIKSNNEDASKDEITEFDDSADKENNPDQVTENITENTSSDVNNDELIEYLDLTYSDDELRAIAKDAGVKRIQSSWDKQALIDKIIITNSEYVIKLMKNN